MIDLYNTYSKIEQLCMVVTFCGDLNFTMLHLLQHWPFCDEINSECRELAGFLYDTANKWKNLKHPVYLIHVYQVILISSE